MHLLVGVGLSILSVYRPWLPVGSGSIVSQSLPCCCYKSGLYPACVSLCKMFHLVSCTCEVISQVPSTVLAPVTDYVLFFFAYNAIFHRYYQSLMAGAQTQKARQATTSNGKDCMPWDCGFLLYQK